MSLDREIVNTRSAYTLDFASEEIPNEDIFSSVSPLLAQSSPVSHGFSVPTASLCRLRHAKQPLVIVLNSKA